MVEGSGPHPKSNLEMSMPSIVCPRCSRSGASDVNHPGTEAEQLANLAAAVTLETTQLLAHLAEIMEGFKQAVENGGQVVDGELGDSLGAILCAVEQVKDEMERVAFVAAAMGSAKLAQMAESLRLDVRSLMQAKNRNRGPV